VAHLVDVSARVLFFGIVVRAAPIAAFRTAASTIGADTGGALVALILTFLADDAGRLCGVRWLVDSAVSCLYQGLSGCPRTQLIGNRAAAPDGQDAKSRRIEIGGRSAGSGALQLRPRVHPVLTATSFLWRAPASRGLATLEISVRGRFLRRRRLVAKGENGGTGGGRDCTQHRQSKQRRRQHLSHFILRNCRVVDRPDRADVGAAVPHPRAARASVRTSEVLGRDRHPHGFALGRRRPVLVARSNARRGRHGSVCHW
jgi:hypothetical protein